MAGRSLLFGGALYPVEAHPFQRVFQGVLVLEAHGFLVERHQHQGSHGGLDAADDLHNLNDDVRVLEITVRQQRALQVGVKQIGGVGFRKGLGIGKRRVEYRKILQQLRSMVLRVFDLDGPIPVLNVPNEPGLPGSPEELRFLVKMDVVGQAEVPQRFDHHVLLSSSASISLYPSPQTVLTSWRSGMMVAIFLRRFLM